MANSTGPASPKDSTGKGVVVTGGGTGIGRATARAFADDGAQVLVVGRSEGPLKETAEGYDGIRVLAADIHDHDAPQTIVSTVLDAFGRLDVLVNNAAVTGFASLDGLDRASVRAQLGTNLIAPLFLTQQALDALEATGGTVVNVSSAGSLGRRAWPENSVYGMAKVALDFLTRTWAVELAPRGIRSVGIAPGVVDTGVGVRAGMPAEAYEAFLAQMAERIPAGRVGRPEDIAWWIVQLTRPEAAYANGTVLAVDGALSVT
ncbi:SDR family NAD(P)-dependent oxidoreductase [Streptomyces sp. NBC_01750]|uniref:SDR family NAD(P)-dependent oxidoreductase n=1 Tax=Streptomyces sp. NBC_01750 TaxID=2975928 RepID=UPI002DD89504|nr:SDR family oxidoreductase [Streptomyces sp. NBC_01750]WSD37267.1 SDR family oxidoreductase [Streptomyces sp. NBC_01750]